MSLMGTALLTCAAMALSPEGQQKRQCALPAGGHAARAYLSAETFDYRSFADSIAPAAEAGATSEDFAEAGTDHFKIAHTEECEDIYGQRNCPGACAGRCARGAELSTEGYWVPSAAVLDCGRSAELERSSLRSWESRGGDHLDG
jgi:uncharacterized protein YgiB involved in biofilm formation